MEPVRDFILGGSKITADGDCSHEIKRHLLLGRKAMTNLDSISKSRDEIHAFQLWRWRRLVRVPWIARRSNQSILKEISPEYSLEGLMLKLKLQYFGHPLRRADSLEKTVMLERLKARGEGDDRGRMVGWHHRLDFLGLQNHCRW